MIFKPGDRVWFGGVKCEVQNNVLGLLENYPITVGGYQFTDDGRLEDTHKKPLLKLVKKRMIIYVKFCEMGAPIDSSLLPFNDLEPGDYVKEFVEERKKK